MANRFYDNYRPSHDGQNVFGGSINNPRHPDTTPKYNPFKMPGDPNQERYGDEGPAGGATVPRKPKPSKPSGGMRLPLPTKVGQ